MRLSILLVAVTATSCTRQPERTLAGDWDAYLASGSTTHPGFEGWRRMGFAHFERRDSGIVGSIRRRTGEPLVDDARVTMRPDTIVITGPHAQSSHGTWHGGTPSGV